MKLKKIASLALAGVMAVSMLAGCKFDNGSSSTTTDDGTTVVTISAADAMNALQNFVDFSAGDAKMESWLASAVQKATYADVKLSNKTAAIVTSGDIFDSVKGKITADYNLVNGSSVTAAFSKGSDQNAQWIKGKNTKLYLYRADAAVSEDSLLNTLSTSLCSAGNMPAYVNVVTSDPAQSGKYYSTTANEATYTGKVSVAKVTKTNDDGETATAYYILVAVTQDVSDSRINLTSANESNT